MTSERDWIADQFQEQRPHLRGVAYRMLGSLSDADDAVQEAWLRVSRADVDGVVNLRAWLTTVVARVSLNMLRSRATRREPLLDPDVELRVDGGLRGVDGQRELRGVDALLERVHDFSRAARFCRVALLD